MPESRPIGTRTRRLLAAAVAFSCALLADGALGPQPAVADYSAAALASTRAPKKGAARPRTRSRKPPPQSQPASQPAPASAPAVPPGSETVAQARRRLSRIRPDKRTSDDHALLTALDFALAIGQPDGRRAAGLLEAVGYQPLPAVGDLPEPPPKPVPSSDVEKAVTARRPVKLDDLPVTQIEVYTRKRLRPLFPAVADWMLAQDRAVIFRPAGDPPLADWVTTDACLVVRIRADKATIAGGNLLQVLGADAELAPPDGKDQRGTHTGTPATSQPGAPAADNR